MRERLDKTSTGVNRRHGLHLERQRRPPKKGARNTLRISPMDETTLDRTAMGRLAKALVFVCGPDHPTTVALQAAAESGSARDIKNARSLFLKLKPGERRAALAMLGD